MDNKTNPNQEIHDKIEAVRVALDQLAIVIDDHNIEVDITCRLDWDDHSALEDLRELEQAIYDIGA